MTWWIRESRKPQLLRECDQEQSHFVVQHPGNPYMLEGLGILNVRMKGEPKIGVQRLCKEKSFIIKILSLFQHNFGVLFSKEIISERP